jgi:hypothetical protein
MDNLHPKHQKKGNWMKINPLDQQMELYPNGGGITIFISFVN